MRNRFDELIDDIEALEPSSDPKAIDPKRLAELLRRERARNLIEESRLRKYERRLEYWVQSKLEMSRAVISFGQSAMRTLLLANGAAAIAILAFLGQILQSHPALVREVSVSITIFSGGVASTSIAAAGSYLTQFLYETSIGKVSGWGKLLHFLSVVCAATSIGCFIWGMIVAATALQNF